MQKNQQASTRTLPFTIYSIDDLDAWRETYSYAYKSEIETELDKGISEILIRLYQDCPPASAAQYRIATKQLFLESFDLLMKYLVAKRMQEREDVEYVMPNHNVPPDASLPDRNCTFELYLGRHDIEFRYLDMVYHDRPYRGLSFWQRARTFCGDIIKGRSCFFGARDKVYVLGPNAWTLRYIDRYFPDSACYLRPHSIFRRRGGVSAGGGGDVYNDLLRRYCEELNELLMNLCEVRLPEDLLDRFRTALGRFMLRVGDDLAQARRYCRSIQGGCQVFTGTAKHYVRVLSEAIRERGGEVTGFPHEGGLCCFELHLLAFTEFACCDNFMCAAEVDRICYQRLPEFTRTEFIADSSLYDSPLCLKSKGYIKPDKISLGKTDKIMYVFFSLYYDLFAVGTRSDTQCLDFQLRALSSLLKLDVKILFKNRPKTVALGGNFNHFNYFNGQIDYTNAPLVETMEQVDLFVFEGVGGASLYEVMTLTNKPIILFKPATPKCMPEFDEELDKRCYIIELHQDSRNRLVFDEEKLLGLFN